jgi:hypothetical protein
MTRSKNLCNERKKYNVYLRDIKLHGWANPIGRFSDLFGIGWSHTNLYFEGINNDDRFCLAWFASNMVEQFTGDNCRYKHDLHQYNNNMNYLGCTYDNMVRGETIWLGEWLSIYYGTMEDIKREIEKEFKKDQMKALGFSEYHVTRNNCNTFTDWFNMGYIRRIRPNKNAFANWTNNVGLSGWLIDGNSLSSSSSSSSS